VFRLVLVTDRQGIPDLESAVKCALSALPPGVAAVQLREKDLAGRPLLALAARLLPICRAHRAPFLVNDRADVALAAEADGVHLPSTGLPVAAARQLLGSARLIGTSCHSPSELELTSQEPGFARRRAEAAGRSIHRAGADFAFFGPVWDTPGKTAQGEAALAEAVRAAAIPVFAIGGVTPATAAFARRAGAHGVACIRSVLGAADPARAAAELWDVLRP
jgi:thiamine-phosphate pyrophosphorylase